MYVLINLKSSDVKQWKCLSTKKAVAHVLVSTKKAVTHVLVSHSGMMYMYTYNTGMCMLDDIPLSELQFLFFENQYLLVI